LGLALTPNAVPAQNQPAKPGTLTVELLDVGQGDSILI